MSWTGLHGNMTFNQTLQYIYSTEINGIEFEDEDENVYEKLAKNITTKFTITNHFCKVLKVYPSKTEKIGIRLKRNESYTVIVNDPGNSNGLLFSQPSGDQILYDKQEGNKELTFLVNLQETKDETGGGSCTGYPNTHYQSFSQCFKDDIIKKTRQAFGFGLPIFTGTDPGPIQRLEKHESTVQWLESVAHDLFGGRVYKPASCLPPCTILDATPKQQHKFSYKYPYVYIYFNNVVKVQTTVLAYGIDSLVVEVGSSLGLWLGLSVMEFSICSHHFSK